MVKQVAVSKRTHHINIRYFFITDRVKNNELQIEYCPTEDMVADFLMKPLQDKLFYKLHKIIMNESQNESCQGQSQIQNE